MQFGRENFIISCMRPKKWNDLNTDLSPAEGVRVCAVCEWQDPIYWISSNFILINSFCSHRCSVPLQINFLFSLVWSSSSSSSSSLNLWRKVFALLYLHIQGERHWRILRTRWAIYCAGNFFFLIRIEKLHFEHDKWISNIIRCVPCHLILLTTAATHKIN